MLSGKIGNKKKERIISWVEGQATTQMSGECVENFRYRKSRDGSCNWANSSYKISVSSGQPEKL